MSAFRRTTARTAAVQALFQVAVSGTETAKIIDEFLEYRIPNSKKADWKLFRRLVEGVREHREEIDSRIGASLAEGWSLERTDTTLLCLLRCALWEISCCEKPPARVVISEYLGISKGFVEERETAFVNAVLDRFAREYRQTEFS